MFSHQSKTTTRHTVVAGPGVKGIIGIHRFNMCLVVVLSLSCSGVKTPLLAEAAEPGDTGGTCPPPPHFSPQSMKCPTSTGVHARPTMYQEGVPRGANKNRKTWGIAPRAINPGGTIKLLHYRAGFFRSLY